MNVRARRARAMLRYRRRGYGPEHALLCRCPECVDYGDRVAGRGVFHPLTDYDMWMLHIYGGSGE